MKLCVLFFLLGILQLNAGVISAQNSFVSLNMHNVKIDDIFKAIEKQSNYEFFYNDKQIDVNKLVSVDVKNAKICDVVSKLLESDNLTYKLIGKRMVLVNKNSYENDLLDVFIEAQQQKKVSGSVTDVNGQTMVGVTVSVKGTQKAVITDNNGNFSLDVPDKGVTLVFSYVGYIPQEYILKGESTINIVLQSSVKSLDEVVVVGYGTTKKANLTGAVAQVSSAVLESRPIVTLGQGLQGTIPNLQVTQSFAPGQGATFNIRGYTSINGGTPLILVDGVIQDPNSLNPEDIASVSVLKDASSAAIYGARASYGVILITTKKGGKDQRPTFKVSSSYTVTRATNLPEVANSMEFVKFVNDANMNTTGSLFYDQRAMDHISAYFKDPVHNSSVYYDPAIDLTGRYNYCGNTAWQDVLYRDGAMKQINASVSGGTAKTQYYVSYGYMGQQGILNVYNDIYNRNNLNMNVNSDVFDWLTLSARTKYTYGYQDHPSQNTVGGFQNWDESPLIPIYLPDGSFSGQGQFTNPFSSSKLGGYDHTKVSDLFITGAITIRPIKNLNLNVDYTFNPYSKNHELYVRSFQENLANGTSVPFTWSTPNAVTDDNINNYYNAINVYADYSRSFKKNNIVVR